MSTLTVKKVAAYVSELLDRQLSKELTFHTKHHTEEVVETALYIGEQTGLNEHELEVLETAAWFHDCGHCYTYIDHEAKSIAVAGKFLNSIKCSDEFIGQVASTIAATKIPQKPANTLQYVICDADLAHLARSNYPAYLQRLRDEWSVCLNKNYTGEEWITLNIKFLSEHHYFTAYGQTVLEPLKQQQVALLKNQQ